MSRVNPKTVIQMLREQGKATSRYELLRAINEVADAGVVLWHFDRWCHKLGLLWKWRREERARKEQERKAQTQGLRGGKTSITFNQRRIVETNQISFNSEPERKILQKPGDFIQFQKQVDPLLESHQVIMDSMRQTPQEPKLNRAQRRAQQFGQQANPPIRDGN